MQTRVTTLLDDLTRLARDVELAAVAVSGGVDSVTLASVVSRALGRNLRRITPHRLLFHPKPLSASVNTLSGMGGH